MAHKFSVGQNVYYQPQFQNNAARGKYKVVRQLPVENDNRLSYRIKNLAEILRAHRRGKPAQPHRLRPPGAPGGIFPVPGRRPGFRSEIPAGAHFARRKCSFGPISCFSGHFTAKTRRPSRKFQ